VRLQYELTTAAVLTLHYKATTLYQLRSDECMEKIGVACAGEPIFQSAVVPSKHSEGGQDRQYADLPLASRLAAAERKLAALQRACLVIEDESSQAIDRVTSVEVRSAFYLRINHAWPRSPWALFFPRLALARPPDITAFLCTSIVAFISL
jgi:hypothetical protein